MISRQLTLVNCRRRFIDNVTHSILSRWRVQFIVGTPRWWLYNLCAPFSFLLFFSNQFVPSPIDVQSITCSFGHRQKTLGCPPLRICASPVRLVWNKTRKKKPEQQHQSPLFAFRVTKRVIPAGTKGHPRPTCGFIRGPGKVFFL